MPKFFKIVFFSFIIAFAAKAQKIESYSADALMKRIDNNDTTYIVNFWATWCIPCVKELPEFNILQELYKDKPVKVLLVSFDFKENYPDKLQEYISKRKILPEVVWFNETNANKFIPKIDQRWSGALPATIIRKNNSEKQIFIEDSITADQIEKIVEE